jgi:hypothetical protein
MSKKIRLLENDNALKKEKIGSLEIELEILKEKLNHIITNEYV